MDYYQNQTPPPYNPQSYEQMQKAAQVQTNSALKRVYVRMFIGLLISAFCALGVASSPAAIAFFLGNPFVYWGMFIAMLVMAFVIPARMEKMSTGTILVLFCIFCALMGCSLASVFMIYTATSITATFFMAAGTFGAMSVYGYFTKTNLDKMGSIFIMALFGLFIAMIVNIFLKSSGLEWVISIIGVLLFVGLTAWDTQQVKRLAQANLSPELTDKLATMGALNLYLDFINLFLFLLRIFGGGRD